MRCRAASSSQSRSRREQPPVHRPQGRKPGCRRVLSQKPKWTAHSGTAARCRFSKIGERKVPVGPTAQLAPVTTRQTSETETHHEPHPGFVAGGRMVRAGGGRLPDHWKNDLDMLVRGSAGSRRRNDSGTTLGRAGAAAEGRRVASVLLSSRVSRLASVSRPYPFIPASTVADSASTSLCKLFPWASIVTMTGKSLTWRCHRASGTPNSNSDTPSTRSTHRA